MSLQSPGIRPATRRGLSSGSPASRRPLHIFGKTVPDGACELVGIDPGVLYVRSGRRIVEDSEVTVAFEHTQLSGYVSGCQPIEQEWVISIALPPGRRREARIPMGEELAVEVVGNDGTMRCQCTVIDRSPSGFGLRLPKTVAIGSRLYLEVEGAVVLGEIRHCHPTSGDQFVAGVEIVESVPDVRGRNVFAGILDRVRWKLQTGTRSRTNRS